MTTYVSGVRRTIASTSEVVSMVQVAGKFKTTGEVLAFQPDRNASSLVPGTVFVQSFAQFPGVSPELIPPIDQVVTVEYNTSTRTIELPVPRWLDRDLLENFPDGTVTLGLVQEVSRQQAKVFVHPSLPIVMTREDFSPNERDVMNHLLSNGDVIPVRIVRNTSGHVKLRAHDIDDDEDVLLAPELFAGHGPWLSQPAVSLVDEMRERYLSQKRRFDDSEAAMSKLAEQFDTDIEKLRTMLGGLSSGTGEIPIVVPQKTDKQKITDATTGMAASHMVRVISNYKREIERLRDVNRELASESSAANASEREARAHLSEERQRNQELTKRLSVERPESGPAERRSHFATAEEWVREEMRRFWIDTYTPGDRQRFVLVDSRFDVLPSFAETFAALDDGEMTKAIRIAVHVVTGRNAEENISEIHDLRSGDSPSAPSVSRPDGAISRRVYVESHTAQARRMHFWKNRDGRIELSRVAMHDDFTP